LAKVEPIEVPVEIRVEKVGLPVEVQERVLAAMSARSILQAASPMSRGAVDVFDVIRLTHFLLHGRELTEIRTAVATYRGLLQGVHLPGCQVGLAPCGCGLDEKVHASYCAVTNTPCSCADQREKVESNG
jgi:hypothetical protein